MITVLSFGAIKDITGTGKLTIDGVHTTDELMERLYTQYPVLKGINFVLAVNRKVVTSPTALEPNDAIALLPPFSGG